MPSFTCKSNIIRRLLQDQRASNCSKILCLMHKLNVSVCFFLLRLSRITSPISCYCKYLETELCDSDQAHALPSRVNEFSSGGDHVKPVTFVGNCHLQNPAEEIQANSWLTNSTIVMATSTNAAAMPVVGMTIELLSRDIPLNFSSSSFKSAKRKIPS